MLISPCLHGARCFRSRSRARKFPVLAITCTFLLSFAGGGVTRGSPLDDYWFGGFGFWTGGPWSLPFYPSNGAMGFPPGTTFNAIIATPGADVTLDVGVVLDNLSVSSGDALHIISGGGATLKTYAGAGTVDNTGVISFGPGGGGLAFDGSGVVGATAILSGGGTVTMTTGSSIAGSTSAPGPVTLTTDNMITGAGTITLLNLINHGTINASFDPAMPMSSVLTIFTPGTTGTVKNVGVADPLMPPGTRKAGTGLLEASMGGTLALNNGTYDNTDPSFPGMISAMGGSKISLGSLGYLTTIKGGTLSSMPGDPVSFIYNTKLATLNGVTLAPMTKYTQGDFTQTNLEGTITNGGTMTLSASGTVGLAGTSILALDSGDATLSGTGGIGLFGFATGIPPMPNLVQIQGYPGPTGAPRLTIGSGQTVFGSGQFGTHSTALSPKITNHGTITALPTAPVGPAQGFTFFPVILPAPPIADAVFNDGTIQAIDNAFVTFNNGIVTNKTGTGLGGTIAAHGHTMPSMVILQEGATVNYGTILLDGPLSLLQLNNGTARPDTLTNSSGGTIITIAGSMANTVGGAVTNSMGSFINVADNSALTLDNATLGGSVTNSSIISVGTGAVGIGPATLTINQGSLTNFAGPAMGFIGVAANGTMNLNGVAGSNSIIDGGVVTILGAGGTINLNGGTIRGGSLINASGGTITTVAPTVTNAIGGIVMNSMGSFIKVADNSALTMDNATMGGSVTNSATISVGTGAAGAAAATLTINQGSLTNFAGPAMGMIGVAANGTMNLDGVAGSNSIINGGAVTILGAGGTINLNNGTIHAGTLTNVANGLITTITGSQSNRLGGTVHNPAKAMIAVAVNSQLQLETGGVYDNPGTIGLNGGAAGTADLYITGAGGNVSLTGGGNVDLGGDNVSNRILGDSQLINVDNTISGGGTILQISLTNRFMGTIQATKGAGLTIDPNRGGALHQFTNGGTIETAGKPLTLLNNLPGFTFSNIDGGNLGTIRAGNGDTLNLTGGNAADAIIDNGLVQVLPAATLNLSTATIYHGTLTNSAAGAGGGGGGTINSLAGTANLLGGNVTNGATINVQAGSTLALDTDGTYSNAGTIKVAAAAGSTLQPSGANGTVTLTGGGSVMLLGAGSSIMGAAGSETFVNQDNTISGAGQIGGPAGAGALALVNRGLIDVNTAPGMTIQPNSAGVTNSGTIQANQKRPLTLLNGTFTNFEGATTGLIQAVGIGDVINLTGVDADNNAVIDGGNVAIVAGGTINLSFGTIHGGTLTNSAAGTINSTAGSTNTIGGTVNNPAGGTIAVVSPSILKLETGGTINNAGTITVTGSDLRPSGDGGIVTLTGGGTVTLAAAGNVISTISGVFGNERLINFDNTINGTGLIGLHMMSLTNDGTIDASALPGITIATNSGGVINGGFLQASGGATLTLDGGIYTNTIGMIRAQTVESGAEVDLKSGVTINGGTVNNNGGDLIRVVDEAVLNTLTNKGNIAQNEGSILDLIGTITNKGTITMPATNFVTQIKLLSGDVTLGGSGTVMMLHSPLNQIIAANGLDRLTIGAGQTVRGTGDIGVGQMALTNNGKIIADQPTSLTIHPNASGFVNTATLQVAAGSTLNVGGGYRQASGDTNVLGTLNVTAGPLTAAGGTLSGSGPSNISGGFRLTGTFTKQDSGTATISGPESFSSSTTLAINGGVVKFNVSSGPVAVGSGATVTVASGAQLELASSVSALAAGSGRVDVVNSSAAPGVLVSGTNQQVGGIDGSGTTSINAGSDLTANHVIQTALSIGGTAASPGALTIAASDASGEPLVPAAADGAGNGISGSLIRADDVLLSSDVPPGAPNAGEVALSFSDLALHDGTGNIGDAIPRSAFTSEGNLVVASTAVVPEPSAAVLVGLASLIWSIVGIRRRTSRLGAL